MPAECVAAGCTGHRAAFALAAAARSHRLFAFVTRMCPLIRYSDTVKTPRLTPMTGKSPWRQAASLAVHPDRFSVRAEANRL